MYITCAALLQDERFPIMKNRSLYILGTLLLLTVVSESGVIAPKEDHSGDGEIPLAINKLDDKLGLPPGGMWGPEEEEGGGGGDDFGMYDFGIGGNDPNTPPDYAYEHPGGGNSVNEGDKDKPGTIKPEKIPPKDEKPVNKDDKEDDIDKKGGDEDDYEPFDGEEDVDRAAGEDEDKKPPTDEEHEDVDKSEDSEDDAPEDEDKKGPGEEEDEDKKEHVPVDDEEEPDNEDVPKEEGDEEHDEEDENVGDGEESGLFHGSSVFETPIFNLEQVKKYFSQLERALGHVFRQTLDEAVLLNGTFANTTEEEVEIDGKKYIVQKSIIQGADNHSSIYIEALSSRSETNDTQEIKVNEAKNETHA